MVEAQRLVLAAWAAILAALVGLGLLERRIFGPRLTHAKDLWQALWVGWALLLTLLQLWHFAHRVDDSARIAVAILAALGWIVAGTAPWKLGARAVWRNAAGFALVAAYTWWLSNRALEGPRFGDTGMYLVPAMHWIESYAVVPGLANLFVPLGHNVTYFLYGALIDAGPFAGRPWHIINTTLFLAIGARGLLASMRLVRGRCNAAVELFYALSLVAVSDQLFSLFLTSPTPDTAVYLFEIVLAGELVAFVSAGASRRGDLLRLVFLSAAGIGIKLSAAGFSLAVAGVAALSWMWRHRQERSLAIRGVAEAAIVGFVPSAIWMARSAVMTGFPLYPSSLFPLPVDWIARVDATAWIQKPMAMAPLWTVFTQPEWWRIRMLSLGWAEADALRPLAMIAVALVVFVVARPIQWWRGQRAAVSMLVLLVPLAGFFFCFAYTPMPRYQGSTLWIFAIDLLVVALASMVQGAGIALRVLPALLALAAAALPLWRGEELLLHYNEFEPASGPRIHSEQLASGLVVNVPENQVCWAAPLPCTPEPHPGLYLRVPGDLASGFAIDPSVPAPPHE